MPKSGGVCESSLVSLTDAVGPRDEEPAVGQPVRRAVATRPAMIAAGRNGGGEELVFHVLGVELRSRSTRTALVIPRVDAHQRAGLDGALAVGGDADHHVGRYLADLNERVGRLSVLPRDVDHLRAVGRHAKSFTSLTAPRCSQRE